MLDQFVNLIFGIVEMRAGAEAADAGGDDRAVFLAEMIDDAGVVVPGGDEAEDAAGFAGQARADQAITLGADAFGEAIGQHLHALPDFVHADFHQPVERSAEGPDAGEVVAAGIEAAGVVAEFKLVF